MYKTPTIIFWVLMILFTIKILSLIPQALETEDRFYAERLSNHLLQQEIEDQYNE